MEKERNGKNILIGVLIAIIIILVGLLVYFAFIKKDNGVIDNNDKTSENSNEVTYNEEYFNNLLSTFLVHLHYYAYNKNIESFDNKEISMYLLYYYTDYANKNNLATYKDNGEITYNVSKKDVDELVLKTFGKNSYEIVNQDNRNGIRKIDDKTYQVYYFATGFYSPNYRLSNTKIESDTAFVEYIVSGNTSMGEPADDKGVITFYLNKNGDNWNVTKIKYNEKSNNKVDEKEKYKLDIYRDNFGNRGLCFVKDDEICNEYVFSIETETKDAKAITTDTTSKLFVLYYDNGMKIYDVNKKTSKKVNIENGYDCYYLFTNDNKTEVIGISYYNFYQEDNKSGGKGAFYNVTLNKELYKNKYNKITNIRQLNDKVISLSENNNKAYLLSAEKEEVLLSSEISDAPSLSYTTYKDNSTYVYSLQACAGGCSNIKIYNSSMKEITDKANTVTVNNKNIYVLYENQITKYDLSGNVMGVYKDYENIKSIAKNYVIYLKNNKLILENIDNKTETIELTTFDPDKEYLDIAGYYTAEDLKLLNESHKQEGLYVGVVYFEKDSNGNYGMEYCYTTDKKIVKYPIKQAVGGRAKPVLYLYPTRDTKVTVSFEHSEYLTTTYPKYLNSWIVYAKTNGDLYDENGKYYYALYWDEKRYHEVDFSEGFYVDKENAISFLEEKLSIIGLNDRERNEFIMYWLPIMEKNEKNIVYFELTEERESSNKLIISPKPDSLLRISIHIKKVSDKINIKEQKLKTFQRVGFAAVEWGGMEY